MSESVHPLARRIRNVLDEFPTGGLTRQETAEVADELDRLTRERIQSGRPVPFHWYLDDEDLAVMAEDSQA
jgi:hypothetical protein